MLQLPAKLHGMKDRRTHMHHNTSTQEHMAFRFHLQGTLLASPAANVCWSQRHLGRRHPPMREDDKGEALRHGVLPLALLPRPCLALRRSCRCWGCRHCCC